MPQVKAFLRRTGGVDEYPAVRLKWQLHRTPELHGYDSTGGEIARIDLSRLSTGELHELFSRHFVRTSAKPLPALVKLWRRLFGWAYGISTAEAAMLFVLGACVLLLLGYTVCCRYTYCCDAISDI